MASVTAADLVGRVTQLEQLVDAAARAATGHPSIVLVAGDAGVGKTRLVRELADRLDDDGWRVATGHCLDLAYAHSPYTPIVEVLRDLDVDVETLETAAALGAPAASDDAAGSDVARPTLFGSFLDVFARRAADAPLLVVVEDLHWADPSTRDSLRYFARAMRDQRLLVVGTYRSDELHRASPWLATLAELDRQERVERIQLEPFDRDEVAEQLAGLLGHEPAVALVTRIHERSDGNAYYVEELIATGDETDPDRVPRSISEIVAVRLARLPDPAQRVAELAAIAGRRVPHPLLRDLSGLDDEKLDGALRALIDAQILTAVDEPTGPAYEFRHALAQEAVYESLMPATRRRTHAAIAAWLVDHDDPRRPRVTRLTDLGHHVYEAGDRAGALRLSVEAADAAMGVFAFGEAQIKYECALDLWEDLPDPETVAGISRTDLLERAADAAGSAPDFVAAIALNRALLEELGPDGDPARRTRRYDRLAWCQWDLGEADAAERTLREAMATMPVDEPRWRARLLAALAQLHWSAAKYLDGVAAAREALATAQAAGDPHEEGWARMILGANLAGSGDAATGVDELELAAGLLERDDAIDNVFAELTWALQLAGRHDDAVELAITAIERADRTGSQRRYVPYFLSNLCDSLDQLGRYAEIGHYLSTVDWPRDGGRSSSWLFQNLVTFHAAQGDLDAARAAAEAARARLPDGAARIDWFWQQFTETELALAEGRLEDAHRLAHAAIDASHDPAHDALLWRFLVIACQVDADLAERLAARRAASARMAELVAAIRTDCAIMDSVVEEARLADRLSPMLETYACRVAAEATRAEGHSDPGRWASASAAAERAGLRPDLAYARFREAEAWLARDHDAGRAAVALGLARQVAVEMGAAPLVARVDDLARRARLDHIGAATAAQTEEPLRVTVDDPWGLSAREREVLTLLGDGMTNRQIGEALFISEKTASVHVTHILTKLGVSSRTEAALLAQRAGDMTSRSPAP